MGVVKVLKCSKCIGLGKTKSGVLCAVCKGTAEIEVQPVVKVPRRGSPKTARPKKMLMQSSARAHT